MAPAEAAPAGEPAADPAADRLSVELVFCAGPGQLVRHALQLSMGATLADALAAGGLSGLGLRTGIWGKARPLETVLRERDRVELYRELTVDPKEARRQRYRRDRGAGANVRRRGATGVVSTDGNA